MKDKKQIITVSVTIVAILVCGVAGYAGYGMLFDDSFGKKQAAEDSKKGDEKADKGKEKEKEKINVEHLTLTDEQKLALDDACWFFDRNRRLSDGTLSRTDYSCELSDNKIPKDLLTYVASQVACGRYSTLGTEITGSAGNFETIMTAEAVIDYLKNTFGYEIKDSTEVSDIVEQVAENGYRFSTTLSSEDDEIAIYDCLYYVQTGEEECHIYVNVQAYDTDNILQTTGVMDITAHKNEKSQIGGFVFDKIDFKAQDTPLCKDE